jgi:hypothetical protein
MLSVSLRKRILDKMFKTCESTMIRKETVVKGKNLDTYMEEKKPYNASLSAQHDYLIQ